jgi:hypothetical protein
MGEPAADGIELFLDESSVLSRKQQFPLLAPFALAGVPFLEGLYL